MANPQLNFRLQRYQIAQGIQYILSLEPNQPMLSPSLIVKTIYLDTIAKATFNKSSYISEKIYAATDAIINAKSLNPQAVEEAWKQASLEKLVIQEGELIVKEQNQPSQLPQPNQPNQSVQEQIQAIQQTLSLLLTSQEPPQEPLQSVQHKQIDKIEKPPTSSSSETELDEQIALMQNLNPENKSTNILFNKAPEEHKTESTITTVSNFSPPDEWKQ